MKNKKLIMLIALMGLSSSIRSLDYEDIFSQGNPVGDIVGEEDAVSSKRQKIDHGLVLELLEEEFKEEGEKLEFIYGGVPEDSNINNELLNETYEDIVDREMSKEVGSDSQNSIKSLVAQKKYPCTKDGCTKSYNSIPGLKYHIKSVHEGIRYKCEEPGCGKSFVQKKDLQKHIESFHDRKIYKCKEDGCNKSYKRKGTLKKHMVMVHGEMHTCKCKEEGCGQIFTQKDDLKLHVKLVHKGQLYMCKEVCCDKSFKQEKYLKAHIRNVHQKNNSQEDV